MFAAEDVATVSAMMPALEKPKALLTGGPITNRRVRIGFPVMARGRVSCEWDEVSCVLIQLFAGACGGVLGGLGDLVQRCFALGRIRGAPAHGPSSQVGGVSVSVEAVGAAMKGARRCEW